jgi:hypothetical protein
MIRQNQDVLFKKNISNRFTTFLSFRVEDFRYGKAEECDATAVELNGAPM